MDLITSIKNKKFKSNIYFIDFSVDEVTHNNHAISHYYTMQEYQCYYTKYSTQTTTFTCKDDKQVSHKFVIPYHIKLTTNKKIRVFFLKSEQIVYKKPVILSIYDLDTKEELTTFEYDQFYQHIDVINMFSIYNLPIYCFYLLFISLVSESVLFFYFDLLFSLLPIIFCFIIFSFHLGFDTYGNRKIWNKTKPLVKDFIKNNI